MDFILKAFGTLKQERNTIIWTFVLSVNQTSVFLSVTEESSARLSWGSQSSGEDRLIDSDDSQLTYPGKVKEGFLEEEKSELRHRVRMKRLESVPGRREQHVQWLGSKKA